ncbi:hypothetical protein GAV44_23310 [Salmonella enterica subsp. enterica serovar Newport]|nr:hypothetical protein [Salmonella enterica subsp. enterica serovar Newport]
MIVDKAQGTRLEWHNGALRIILPDTREEWREYFPDGLPFKAIEEAYQRGLMIEQRYLHALSDYFANTRYRESGKARPNALIWRYQWEPPQFRLENRHGEKIKSL